MGCWNETCVITQKALSIEDKEVYCVILPLELNYQFRVMFNLPEVAIALGKIDSYGTLYDVKIQTHDLKEYSVETARKIKMPLGRVRRKTAVFCLKSAWDAVVERVKSSDDFEYLHEMYYDRFPGVKPLHPLIFEWYLIENFLRSIRRTFILNSEEFSGSQDDNPEDLQFANSL